MGLTLVEREMRGLRAVRGMDLTYDIVAHVFRGDHLIGVLTETCEASRLVRPVILFFLVLNMLSSPLNMQSDRAAVFATFARLERAFMLHINVDWQHVMIDENGRVRILDLESLIFYGRHERQRLERDAQKYHWDKLQELCARPLDPPPAYPVRFMCSGATILARTPSPERVLLIITDLAYIARVYQDAHDEKKTRKSSSKRLRGNPKTVTVGAVSLAPKAHTLALSKMPRSIENNQPPPPPPYSESPLPHQRPGFRRVLLAPPPEDTIEYSGASIVEIE